MSDLNWPAKDSEPADRRRQEAEWLCAGFAASRGNAKGRRVLDVDCGPGYVSFLAGKAGAAQVFGVTDSAPALAWAGAEFAGGVVRFREGPCGSLPLASGDVDLVISLETLERQRDAPGFIAELHRVLAPGGLLVVRAAALDILRSRHSAFAFERQRFTRRRMAGMAESAGFRVLRCTYVNSLLLPVALARFRIWEPLLRQPASSGVQPVAGWLDGMLYSALALESRWVGAGHGFPAGQSLLLLGEKL